MSIPLRLTLTLVFILPALSGRGQSVLRIQRVHMEHLGQEQGLSQGMIRGFCKDKRGFIWMATKDGLNRYDGYRFKVYRQIPGDTNSLSDNNVHMMTTDQRGLIWITYHNRNVDVFNPETEKTFRLGPALQRLHLPFKGFTSINSFQLASGSAILYDSYNWLWATVEESKDASGFGYRIRLENQTRFLPFTPPETPGWFSAFVAHNQNLYLSSGDSVWVYAHPNLSQKPGCKKYHYTRFICKRPFSTDPAKANDPMGILFEDTLRQRFCVRHWLAGVYQVYDFRKGKAIQTYHQGRNNMGGGYFDAEGNAWIGSYRGHLKWNMKDGTMNLIMPKNPEISDEQMTGAYGFLDPSGNFFVGTIGYGVYKFNPRADRFHHVPLAPDGGMPVNEVLEDTSRNQLWVNHLWQWFRYSLSNGRVSGKPKLGKTKGENVLQWYGGNEDSLFHAHTLLPDAKGYWMVDYGQVLCTDKDFNILQSWFKRDTIGNQHKFIKAPDGSVWLARFMPLSLYRFDGFGKPGIQHVSTCPTTSLSPYPFVSAALFDAESQLWIATPEGLLQFNQAKKEWKHFKSLPGKIYFSLCQDPIHPNTLWIGTNGSGLLKFDKQTGKCQAFNTKNSGIPNDVIYGLLDDHAGNIWLSTNQGLARFNIKTYEVKVFTAKDGLQGNEFNRYSYTRLSDGRLCFGGMNGLNVFDPVQIRDNDFKPTVFFTDFKIGNKPVWGDSLQTVLEKEIFATPELHLSHTQNYFTFQFASSDYTNPASNLFQYQLVGLDTSWQPPTTSNEATYTNLDPGEYTFQVRTANADGIWSPHIARMPIFISPPWWGTWWFRSLAVLSFGGMLYGFYRYRLAQELKIIRLRDKIALDLHDEIGSTLSSISLFGEAARRMLPEDHKVNQVLNRINSDTKNMMESMGDIVWSINSRNDRFDNLVNRIRAFVVQVMEAKGATVDFRVSDNLNELNLDMEQRKNLFLLVKEAVNNAAKYSGCTVLKVELRYDHHQIHMTIADDGKGFDLTATQNGNGLHNMKKRANDLKATLNLDSEPGKGTKVEAVFGV